MDGVILVVLIGGLLSASHAQLTVTVTDVVTRTETQTSTVNVRCTNLVNVTGDCRRRRGRWLDEPTVLIFDDYDDSIPVIVPAPIHWVEMTAEPAMKWAGAGGDRLQSTMEPAATSTIRSRSRPEARVGFQQLVSAVAAAVGNVFGLRTTATTTTTSTQTETTVAATTSTDTVFIMGCTTPPFTGSLCSNSRRYL